MSSSDTHADTQSPQELPTLLPIGQLQALLDGFNDFFPAVTAILDLQGQVLQASGWQDVCTKFHRANPASCANCIESDTWLANHVQPGQFVAYQCKNGLWDVVTPLYVDGVRTGNLYTGQFFYDDETVDEARFADQARRFGYDVPAYLEALRRVPRISRARVEQVMRFLVNLTSLLSQLGHANAHLAKDLKERQKLLDALQTEQESRRTLERSMFQAQKLESLGLLAGGIAHDFNNLLTAVTTNLELARHDVQKGTEAADALDQGLAATTRASELTRQLLAYSGRGRFVVEPIELGKLVADNAAMLRSSVPRRIELTLTTDAKLPRVKADKTQLQQVVMNLLINAAESIGEAAGQVSLVTRAVDATEAQLAGNRLPTHPTPGPMVLLEVRDTGCGMDERTLERIFDPFFTTKFTGRGLGMAAVHGILSNHGAALCVESVVGVGTTMRCWFPACEAPAQPVVEASPPRAVALTKGTVLVVDDEALVANSLRRLLMRLGYEVLVAEGGEQALALAEEHGARLGLAIIDLTMPVMTGSEVATALHAKWPGLPLVLSSGFDLEPVSGTVGEGGVVGFLHKPYTLDALKDVASLAKS